MEELQVIPPSSLEALTRGEIDVQIATAHRFPRSMASFKRRALEMATLDEETAASCIYSRPVGGGKFAEGMSVRMAEIIGASYGNLRVGAMIVSQTDRQVTVRGFAHDLESNFASTSEVVEATIKRDGTPYDERMRVVIAKAALAKARRDATFQVVPKALCKPVEAEARKVAIGDASTIEKRRTGVLGWISKLGISPDRVWLALGIKGEADLGLDELTTLTGLKTAIKDGEVTIDEAFPAGNAEKPKFVPASDSRPEEKTPITAPEEAKPTPAAPEQDRPVSPLRQDQPIPDEPQALLGWLLNQLIVRDLDEAAVVEACKARGWSKSAKRVEELSEANKRKLAAAIDEITKEIGG